MNSSDSTTGRPERLEDARTLTEQWQSIDWEHVGHEVNRLQTRIAKAQAKGDTNKVRRLQYLLTHSFHAKAQAVRKVTSNKGKNTSGVDKVLWSTPAAKMRATLTMTDRRYRAKPLRRVYIEKKGKRKKRPLGIPTMYDRAMQTLYALALEPVAEVTADDRSFGFRKGRCAQDACEQAFTVLARTTAPEWILDADIEGCFDNISHTWLLDNILMDKRILKQFLRSGFIHNGELFPTHAGSPQGGSISSVLANMALDGIERLVHDRYARTGSKVNLIRYADDMVITARTRETAEEVKRMVAGFLKERGLTLSEEKTAIIHIDDGFDFLGWTFRKFKGKLLIKPSKKSVKALKGKLSDIILREGKAHTQSSLITRLNQVLRGWGDYHKHIVAKKTFSAIDCALFYLLRRWAKHRHPHKGRRWQYNRYWHTYKGSNWRFMDGDSRLITLGATPIKRHTRLRISNNPFLEPEYFKHRKHG